MSTPSAVVPPAAHAFPFPEHLFPPAPACADDYRARLHLGRRRLAGTTVVIAGLARNIAACLPRTIANIQALGALFADYRVVLYENDSSDATPALLAAWARQDPRLHLTSESLSDPVNPSARCLQRAQRMAVYRNSYLATIRRQFPHFEHAIVVDTDLHVGWSLDGIAHTFSHDHWDFVASNGIIFRRDGWQLNAQLQYDAWAFRRDDAFTPMTTRAVNTLHWSRGEPLVPLTCAFGGLGVYRMPAFLAGGYSGEDVDHVTHQKRARAAGFRNVFLNPSQITLYGRHHRRSDRFAVPLLKLLSPRHASV